MKFNKKSRRALSILVILAVILFANMGIVEYAEAFLPSGGYHASILTYCTCGTMGYMSFIVGVPGTASGLFYFAPYTMRLNTTSMMPGANWLGFSTPGAGMCFMLIPTPFGAVCLPIFFGSLMNAYGASH